MDRTTIGEDKRSDYQTSRPRLVHSSRARSVNGEDGTGNRMWADDMDTPKAFDHSKSLQCPLGFYAAVPTDV